MKGTLK